MAVDGLEPGVRVAPAPQRPRRTASLLSGRLAQRLRLAIGPSRFGPDGRVLSRADVLVPGLDPARAPVGLAADWPRLRDPSGGPALALNSFLAWGDDLGALRLAGEGGFEEIRFDARCPTGVRGTPPHLDLILANGAALVAVRASGLDFLQRNPARLGPAYIDVARGPGLEPWQALAGRLVGDPGAFRIVDAGTIVKHAVGLARTFPDRRLRLLYLFLEPKDAEAWPVFRLHRAELATIAALSRGSAVELRAMGFAELWAGWAELDRPAGLSAVVARLQERYDVAIAHPPRR